jgi:hypothetical protein
MPPAPIGSTRDVRLSSTVSILGDQPLHFVKSDRDRHGRPPLLCKDQSLATVRSSAATACARR